MDTESLRKKILQTPHPILERVADEIEIIDSRIVSLAQEMEQYFGFEIRPGVVAIGLAAPQLGVSVRLIAARMDEDFIFIVNPVVVKASPQTYWNKETCLSVAYSKVTYTVKRHKIVKVKGLSLEGREVTYKGRDLFGAILQHEIDHLNGITIDKR